jgi:hypothetical protein
MKILNQVGSLLSSLQGNKVLQKLTKRKDQGLYKNEIEFKQALKANLLDITATQDMPLYVPTSFVPGIAYSEVFNNNTEEILLDLEVLFEEINFLFSKIKSHEVFFDRSIQESEILLKKLDQNLESAKIEASTENAFNKIFHNTFIDASNKIDFANIEAKEFYYDFPLKRRATLDNLCPIDIKQGKISLPKFSSVPVSISEAKILTTETTVSDYNVSFPGNNISNITTSSPIESWSHSILTRKKLSGPAKLVLMLDLGDIKEFNSITLDPNASSPIYLDEIYTIDGLGVKHNLPMDKGLLVEQKTFLFNKTLSKAIYVAFKQDSNKVIPHDPSEPVSLAELQRDPKLPLSVSSISGQIKESIKDPSIKNILGLQQIVLSESVLVYYYSFSLRSIQIGNDDYRNKGIYVSKPETFDNLRNLAIYTKDFIPTAKHWQTGIEMPSGSVEYILFKKDYNASNKLIKTTAINVLPVGTAQILNERLLFEEAKVLALRFTGHKADGDGSNIEIYRNGELLIRGVDWKFKTRQSSDPADYMVDVNQTKTIIELTQSNDQIYNGVYWAKYTPRFVSQPDLVVIDNGVRFSENCSIITPGIIHGQEIAKSDVYVQVIIRNHTESSVLSPYVDYYRLAGKEE